MYSKNSTIRSETKYDENINHALTYKKKIEMIEKKIEKLV